jgi:predicted DNA-binding antitoxin AbrB/MazE fold protein
MEKTVHAVYEDGVLRPLEPIPLEERQEVTVTISDEVPRDHPLLASPEEWADAAGDQISLDEVRRALATIRGSLSEAVIGRTTRSLGAEIFSRHQRVGEDLP